MDRPVASSHTSQSQSRIPRYSNDPTEPSDVLPTRASVPKGPKRKRLIKACDPCHKSKRRCDGTAPCSNCYFASKECTYTDSTGRPVPAPNSLRPDILLTQPSADVHSPTNINSSAPATASGSYQAPEPVHFQTGIQQTEPLPSASAATSGSSLVIVSRSPVRSFFNETPPPHGLRLDLPRDLLPPRKRPKNDTESSDKYQHAAYRRMDGTDTSVDFQKHIVHELINLFFAHCHPHRLIIHSTSFHVDLCRGRIPNYLLNAICAVAAPLSQNPLIRVTPVRHSGERFANAVLADLFDAEGRLMASGLEAAQALALVQTYIVYKESSMHNDLRLYDIALRILHTMHTRDADQSTSDTSPLSPDELHARGVRRESARRTFWLIHLVEVLGAVFTRRPTMYNREDLAGVRLPSDETSFDLALQVPSVRAEYLDCPPLKTRDTSEFGHVIRIASILLNIERGNMDRPDHRALSDCEQELEQWVLSLADHLKYSSENLQAHLTLWETGSNSSTWCYCFMHILHACAVLAISSARRRLGQPDCRDHDSALQAFPVIIKALGPRARNSILMGSVLWVQYCGPHAAVYNGSLNGLKNNVTEPSMSSQTREGAFENAATMDVLPQLDLWVKEWEEFWGPATMHGNVQALEPGWEERCSAYQQLRSTAASVPSIETTYAGDGPSSTAMSRNVPDVVIDSVLRPGDEGESTPPQLASPSLSTTSTLRLRLPSLKSSGLLDVLPDDSLGSRSSGASTPVKVPQPWQLNSNSPRPPLLSPGLPISVGSGSIGSAPLSPQPHSPSFQDLHTPQVRLQAPNFYQSGSVHPSPGIVAAPSSYEETEGHFADRS
ncbi:hypothetical protein ACEPAI_3909 [Sanghuangporus weigelae]